jgi:antitoxin component YwqK of YwqJK toxin-antitoxin module
MGTLKLITTILLLTVVLNTAQSQENKEENGKKVGLWAHKDTNGLVYAEGNYSADSRDGHWNFYLSEISRKEHVPDVSGSYSNSGMKQGDWNYSNLRTETNVKVQFENDLMQGECTYSDANKNILARGLMQDGIRHGKWIFYDKNTPTGGYHKNGLKLNKKITEGYYKDGIRIGLWAYDYFLDKNTHVKGELTFEKGENSGRFDFYKVENHSTFGRSESLAGSGSFFNGKKIGRWIEFNYGTKGDFVETGNYDNDGKRDGSWKVRIGNQTYLAGNYNHGVVHGKFNHYYESGQVKYESTYNNGLEEGEFKRYYKNGQVQEQGTNVIISGETKRDTSYFSLKLPYEYNFFLIEEDFASMNYGYITWLNEPGHSIAPAELDRRFNLYTTYGLEKDKRVGNIVIHDKKTVREGSYMAFYTDGSLKLKGDHSPTEMSIFDPNTHSVELGFTREGEWKEYSTDRLLKSTYIYEDGKLKKMLDANGYIVHTFKYEQGGTVNMTDTEGNTVNIDPNK